jgi:protein gp37
VGASGRLPNNYEDAKAKLAACVAIDECQDWANKAEALASYARQIHDDELRLMADRIQARAIYRAGELLKAIPRAHGANQNIRDGAGPNVLTRTQAAEDAGLSERQRKTALRVNNVPFEEFERAIESARPPTITELAARGIKSAQREMTPGETRTIILRTWNAREVSHQIAKNYKPTFNETDDEVGWARWTWNPVTGCLHECQVYCYAKDIAEHSTAFPVGFTPVFRSERLDAPKNTPVPDVAEADPWNKRVFVVSMGDLFGKWVPREWNERVFAVCTANPQWDYLFLTKDPKRYLEFIDKLPPTAWLGASVDTQKRVRPTEDAFRELKHADPLRRIRWLSVEPMLESVEFSDLSLFDWVVIGALSATRQHAAFAPQWEWVVRLWMRAKEAGCRVYLKSNLLGVTDDQFPGMVLPRESPVLREYAPRIVEPCLHANAGGAS